MHKKEILYISKKKEDMKFRAFTIFKKYFEEESINKETSESFNHFRK